MHLIHTGLLNDGAGKEQERRNLVESEAVFESECQLSLGRFGFSLLSLDD
jgi:hypothetical protein